MYLNTAPVLQKPIPIFFIFWIYKLECRSFQNADSSLFETEAKWK